MKRIPLLALFFVLAACAPLLAAPTPTATPIPPTGTATAVPPTETPTFTPIPTLTDTPAPTPTPRFQLDDGNMAVVYDFTARVCEANWMNGGEKNLPCPGDLNDPSHGYVGLLSGSDQGLDPAFAMILMLPAQPSSTYGGIFGRFPATRVGPFDLFRASLTCRSDAPCDVEFQLAYYDSNGAYQDSLFPPVLYKQGDPPINYSAPVGRLGGKTVEFVLVVRDHGDPANAWGLWIAPRILRP